MSEDKYGAARDELRSRAGGTGFVMWLVLVLSLLLITLSFGDWGQSSGDDHYALALRYLGVFGLLMASVCGVVTYLLYSAAAALDRMREQRSTEA